MPHTYREQARLAQRLSVAAQQRLELLTASSPHPHTAQQAISRLEALHQKFAARQEVCAATRYFPMQCLWDCHALQTIACCLVSSWLMPVASILCLTIKWHESSRFAICACRSQRRFRQPSRQPSGRGQAFWTRSRSLLRQILRCVLVRHLSHHGVLGPLVALHWLADLHDMICCVCATLCTMPSHPVRISSHVLPFPWLDAAG